MRGCSLFSKLAVEVVTALQKEWDHEACCGEPSLTLHASVMCSYVKPHTELLCRKTYTRSVKQKAFGHLKLLVCPQRHFLRCCAAKYRAESDSLAQKQSVMMRLFCIVFHWSHQETIKFLVPSLAIVEDCCSLMEKCQNPTEIHSKKKPKQKRSPSFVCVDKELSQKMPV